jgi:hypothetical protein
MADVTLDIYNFAGVNFGPKADDAIPRVQPYQTFTSERHVPYSNLTIFDVGGRAGARHVSATVRVTPALVAAFEALLLVTDTLIWDSASYPNTTMINLTNKRITPLREFYWFDVEFLVA